MTKEELDSGSSQHNEKQTNSEADVAAGSETSVSKTIGHVFTKASLFNMPAIVSVVLAIGIFISIAASHGVQKYREKYVIPPQKERTILFPFKSEHDLKALRNIINGSSLLYFQQIDNPEAHPITFNFLKNHEYLSLNDLESYEYKTPDVYNGGKFTFKYGLLSVTINYVFHPNFTISAVFDSFGESIDGTSDDFIMEMSYGPGNRTVVPLTHGSKQYHSFPSEQGVILTTSDIDEQISKLETNWQEKFNNLILPEQQQRLPRAYIELIESSYSFLVNSLNYNRTINVIGRYENFTLDQELFYLQSPSSRLNSLEEQVFPLMAMLKTNKEDTLKVLKSWLSLVNELGYMGNRITENGVLLNKIQLPMLFQLVKHLLENPELYNQELYGLYKQLENVAEQTWRNSIGPAGLEDMKWLGQSRGIFQLEPATSPESSSFELLCLLGDMSRVMKTVYERIEISDAKWSQRFLDFEATMPKYWSEDHNQYGDIIQGKIQQGLSSHVPVILNLLPSNFKNLEQVLQNLQTDPNFTQLGLQISEMEGVAVSTNYLLLQSLKRYAVLSNTAQELSLQMYSVLKNNLATIIARANRQEKSFYGRFDKNMRPLGSKGNLDATLIFPIMSSSF